MKLFILGLLLPLVLLTSQVRANEGSEEVTPPSEYVKNNEDAAEITSTSETTIVIVSPEQVVILEEGLFYVNSQGNLVRVKTLYSTSKGIVAKHYDKLCRGCGREISHNTCYNPGCDYYRIHQ